MAHVKARSRGRRYSERRAGSRGAGPRAAGAGNWRLGAGCAMRMQPTDAAQIVATGALRPPRTPSARRRSRRRTTGGGRRNGPPASGGAKRVMPPNPGIRKCRPEHLRHGRAGCASAFATMQRSRLSAVYSIANSILL